MAVHLEPCPLCAGDKIKAHYIRDGESLGCTECGCRVRDYQPNAGDKCIEKWNRRDAEMTTLRYCEKEWQSERDAFFSIIAKLRTALQRIAENDPDDGLHMFTPQAMQLIARDALAASPLNAEVRHG